MSRRRTDWMAWLQRAVVILFWSLFIIFGA